MLKIITLYFQVLQAKYSLLVPLLFFLFTSSWLHADEVNNQDNAELIKLRIKELELKKEILELEAKKDNRNLSQQPSQQSYPSPQRSYSNSGDSSRFIRGPRGGCYTYSGSGNKRYVDRSLCN